MTRTGPTEIDYLIDRMRQDLEGGPVVMPGLIRQSPSMSPATHASEAYQRTFEELAGAALRN